MYILVPSGLNKTPVGTLCCSLSQFFCPTNEETAPKVFVFEKNKIIKDIILKYLINISVLIRPVSYTHLRAHET